MAASMSEYTPKHTLTWHDLHVRSAVYDNPVKHLTSDQPVTVLFGLHPRDRIVAPKVSEQHVNLSSRAEREGWALTLPLSEWSRPVSYCLLF